MEFVHAVRGLIELVKIFREDPRIALALVVLILSGLAVSVLMRKNRRDEVVNLNLRK